MSLTVDDDTYAANPGGVEVDPIQYLGSYPGWPLVLGAAVAAAALGVALSFAWWAWTALALTVLLNIVFWTRVKEHFRKGCINPALVVDPRRSLIAVYGDLANRPGGVHSVVKVLRQPLHRVRGGLPEEGTKLSTVALYAAAPGSAQPHWADFSPRVVDCATRDPETLERVRRSIPPAGWRALRLGLAQLPRPLQTGLYRVELPPEVGEAAFRGATLPDWASFLTVGQYRLFLDHVANYWRAQGRELVFDDGVVHLSPSEDGSEGWQHLGLGNLAQVCNRCPMDDWPEVVAAHFETLRRAGAEHAALAERVQDFEEVRAMLAVRLYEGGMPDDVLDNCLHREDLPGVHSVLVFDLPTTIRQVGVEDTRAWGKSREELFAIGIRNVMEAYADSWQIERIELEPGLSVTAVMGEDFFVPTLGLVLGRRPELVGTHGSVVVVPHRHVLIAYPIEDLDVLRVVHGLIPIAIGMHHEGPGSVSPQLYWYHEGSYQLLPVTVDEDSVTFSPPPDFVRLLNRLAE